MDDKNITDSALFIESAKIKNIDAVKFMKFINHGYTNAICKVHENAGSLETNGCYFKQVIKFVTKSFAKENEKRKYSVNFSTLFVLFAYIEYFFNTNSPEKKHDKVSLIQTTMNLLDEARFYNVICNSGGFYNVLIASKNSYNKRNQVTSATVSIGIGVVTVCCVLMHLSFF